MSKGYQLLIVDDEELAIRGIEKGVCWEKLNIEKIFTCNSSEAAEEILQNEEIHILLSDIELGGSTGIELIEWVKRNQPDVVCIFFTCHAEFEYAQKAIRLGVRDYLLKPVSSDKLERCITEAIEVLDAQKSDAEKFSFIEDIVKDNAEEKTNKAVQQVKLYITKNLAQDLRREDLAKLVNFSTSYLSKIFKEHEGISLTEYILDQRIKMSKYLLKVTELSITDVALRTGFTYHSYFTRLFKKYTAYTPQQYREKSRVGLETEEPMNTDLDNLRVYGGKKEEHEYEN